MSFKVFVTLAAISIAFCNASHLPKSLDAKTSPEPQDPTTLPNNFIHQLCRKIGFNNFTDPATLPKPLDEPSNQTVGTTVQQCEDTTDQEYGKYVY